MIVRDIIDNTLNEQKIIIADIDNDTIYYNDYIVNTKLNIKNELKKYLEKEIKIIYAYDKDTIKIFIKI